jgi:hypothetical protein
MKRKSSKPANGEVDPDLAHQLTVVNYAGSSPRKGETHAHRPVVRGSALSARCLGAGRDEDVGAGPAS